MGDGGRGPTMQGFTLKMKRWGKVFIEQLFCTTGVLSSGNTRWTRQEWVLIIGSFAESASMKHYLVTKT